MSEMKNEILTADLSLPEKAEALARGYFREGLNCAECVVKAFLDLYETSLPPEIIGLASGFGGGMGKTKNTCGAVTGAVMALGIVKGRPDPFALETPKERAVELGALYKPFGAMVTEIKENYGTLICSELCNPLGDFEGRERKKSCQQIIGYCAAKAVEYADDKKSCDTV